MPLKRVAPEEAKRLVDEEGYVYVDVRSVPEFEAGHPEGAYNVPLAHLGRMGMTPNPDFLRVMEERFGHDAKIVLGCQTGGRSFQAASILLQSGFRDVIDQRAGFDGTPRELGWRPQGLPVATVAAADHTWDGLK